MIWAFSDPLGAMDLYEDVGGDDQVYDSNAARTSDGTLSTPHDVYGRIESASESTMVASYSYDPAGRRVRKTVNSFTSVFLHAGNAEIAEMDTAGAINYRYVPTPDMSEILHIRGSGNQDKWYLHKDRNGSTIAVTKKNGSVVERNAYDPFGQTQTTAVSGGAPNPFKYAGQRQDIETGLYVNRGLIYDPRQGRFVSPGGGGRSG